MSEPKTKEWLLNFLKTMWLGPYQTTINTLREKLTKDPADALYWSFGAFEAAAKVEVAKEAIAALSAKATPETLREYAMKETYRFAKAGMPRSTNPTSNVMEACRMAAWAELSDILEGRTLR